MTTTVKTGRRAMSAGVLLVGGGAVAAATWIGGHHTAAGGLVAFYVVAAAIAFAWSGGTGDVAALMRASGDERQRAIDRDATALAGLAMGAAAVAGSLVQAARDADPTAYGIVLAVGAVVYAVTLGVLRSRR